MRKWWRRWWWGAWIVWTAWGYAVATAFPEWAWVWTSVNLTVVVVLLVLTVRDTIKMSREHRAWMAEMEKKRLEWEAQILAAHIQLHRLNLSLSPYWTKEREN